ncbi:hypothetical protein C5B85_18075 [Pseudoclavibacter sp. AY1F1]|nr:hypothetical protein C5B85_18075 [Pseudoclavibacter sp. AY1F1]
MPPFDGNRPFGILIRMAWWKSLIVIVALPLTLVVTQLLFYLLAGRIEDRDQFAAAAAEVYRCRANPARMRRRDGRVLASQDDMQ